MNKLDACRAAIVAANPDLARDPDRFLIWADKGRIVTRRTAVLGYEWRYRANLLFQSITGSPDDVVVPLLLWLRAAQPDLLLDFDKGDQAVAFEVHILDATSWDMLIQFELTQAVTIAPRDGGGWDVTQLPEPSPEDPALTGAAGATLQQLWSAGEQLVPPA